MDKNKGIIAEYTSKNGLPGSIINKIYIAPDKKKVWALSDSGIACFNGSIWRTYTVQDGLVSNHITSIVFASGDIIWMGSDKGVSRFKDELWESFTTVNGLVSNDVLCLAVDLEGIVWIGTSNGLAAYDGMNWKSWTTNNGLIDNRIHQIEVDSNNNRWLASPKGLLKYDGNVFSSFTTNNGLKANNIMDIIIEPDNSLWISTEALISTLPYKYSDYLQKYDGNSFIEYFAIDSSEPKYAKNLMIDNQDRLFYNVGNWLYIYDKTGKTIYHYFELPSSSYLSDMVVDADGEAWELIYAKPNSKLLHCHETKVEYQLFGSFNSMIQSISVNHDNTKSIVAEGGFSSFDGYTWNYVYTDNILSLTISYDNSLWMGMDRGNGTYLARMQGSEIKEIATGGEGSIPGTGIQAITFDNDNILWLGYDSGGNGITRYDGTSWTNYTTADGLINDNVSSIAVDSSNAKWFGTSAGISRFDGVAWKSFPTAENGNPVGNVTVLAADSTGVLWAGTNNGLIRYDGSSWARFTPKEGLVDTLVLSLAVTAKGVVWAGTPNGLSRYDGKTWKTFTTADGLPSNRVQALAADHNDVVWIGTDAGLVSYADDGTGTFVNHEAAKPAAFPVIATYPNPFNPSTMIECTLSGSGLAELAVYSITGQKMRTLVAEKLPAGKHSFLWDGKDDAGNAVSSGIYIARLKSGGSFAARKMVLVK